MEEGNGIFDRPERTAFNVAPEQVTECGTKLNIHSIRLPQFPALASRNCGPGIALTNGSIETHIKQNETVLLS